MVVEVVITEKLLRERVAALLAREGKDSFMAMKAPQFFEHLQVRDYTSICIHVAVLSECLAFFYPA